jgi:hypothetical protein
MKHKYKTLRKTLSKILKNIALKNAFWYSIVIATVVYELLGKVLQLVNSDDKSEINYLYKATNIAKKLIRKYGQKL